MVVPGKNMGDNSKKGGGNLGIYIGLGIGLSALIVGIFFLFRFVIFPPEIDDEAKENDIDEILNSIKKENHSENINKSGGVTETDKSLKEKIEEAKEQDMDVKSEPDAKKSVSVKSSKSSPISAGEAKHQKDNNINNKTAVLNEQKIEQKKSVQTASSKEMPVEKKIEIPIKIWKKGTSSVYKFTIQIASYKNPENARKEMKNLEDKKFAPELITVDLGDKGTWYRLRTGKYKTQEEAKTGIWELNSIGLKNVVITPY